MATFTVAVLQLEIARGDNLARMRAEIESVVARTPWVQMVVLGELSVFGSGTDRAEPPAGPIEREFCRIAAALRLWLLPGSLYVRHDDGQVFNTIPVINPAGEVVARHRKMFPFLPYETGVTPGTDFVVFDIPKCGRIGVSNCYDMWFPETTRTLAAMGAEVILHPSMTNTIDRDVELAIVRASAAINQCYFFDVNVAGPLGFGRSIVCGPGGEVIHQAGQVREVFPVEVDFDYVRRVRRRGWQGVGQVLKSFRDRVVDFPACGDRGVAFEALQALGPLSRPERE
jgi:deaminated glutathione amidase